jgi:hypothetical protein
MRLPGPGRASWSAWATSAAGTTRLWLAGRRSEDAGVSPIQGGVDIAKRGTLFEIDARRRIARMGADVTNFVDVVVYAGAINREGYEQVSALLRSKKRSDHCIILLTTPGGDPNAGFRIARALQHTYGSFDALVPRYCKSAGTLIVTGAKKLYLDDMSELGPLDIQIKKGDELVGRNSGLDILQAVNYLKGMGLNSFREYLVDLTNTAQLSTKVASDISVRLVCGLLEPIASQIDPIKLAEMQRATEVAMEYGSRLIESGENMTVAGLIRLVTGYPSHGFVIDRKEARKSFNSVEKPTPALVKLGRQVNKMLFPHVDSPTPTVDLFQFDLDHLEPTLEPSNDQDTPDSADGERSPPPGISEVLELGTSNPPGSC